MLSSLCFSLLLTCGILIAAQRATIDRLLQLANSQPDSSAFRNELTAALGAENIRKGTAVAGDGPDFIWEFESSHKPRLYVNDEPFGEMRKIAETNLWFYAGKRRVGDAYKFHYVVDGASVGGSLNIPAYTPDSYAQ